MSIACAVIYNAIIGIRPQGWIFWIVLNVVTWVLFSLAGYAVGKWKFEDIQVEEI